jgi:CcmD family protein
VTTAEMYVTAAYCAVFAIVLVYVLIIALKVQRLEREVDELAGRAAAREEEPEESREAAVVG